MADEEPRPTSKRSLPPWVMTFADLMTLLMCFFVLLLSFSEMDVAKFKELSGSMKDAFGVQAKVESRTIPKGTSIIAREFSPGKPEPTALNVVNQFTVDSNKNTLDALDREKRDREDTLVQARRLRLALRDEIKKGAVSIETLDMKVIIHIHENASFESGSADVRAGFQPVLQKIAGIIDDGNDSIMVSGHTDNIPISNERFRSNWELSTARAVSVTHEILRSGSVHSDRIVVTGHADTRPIAENKTAVDRAKNRRVDISIIRGENRDEMQKKIISMKQQNLTVTGVRKQ